MSEKNISVILPVYNSEKTIAECIDNALLSLREYDELIIIDDGSTDDTSNICMDYAWNYSNIIYRQQERKGLFNARLEGIKIATGEYVSFIDADDVCAEKRFEVMHSVVSDNDADIIFFGAIIKKEGCDTQIFDADMFPGKYSSKKIIDSFGKMLFGRLDSDDNSYTGYLWNTLISRDALNGLEEYADEKIRYYDDEIIMLHALMKAQKCVISEKKLYRYESTKRKALKEKKSYSPKNWENIFNVYNLKREMAIENDMYNSDIKFRLSTFLGPISFMRFIVGQDSAVPRTL
ncbi:Glycosyl transferase family 2 [Butyrivibrio proteoclasticus]|uniref:Glycosyl transferase family 2 n=1 Tax=Butyrivibrio proteoclasticus TaxID=43305 RepID=A0A1I5UML3_9FIRM|nr:glycosyltransferase family 2 protein [Butyrivibrio proteoclasticus]SFP96472.1 Glycosyl transferase family 2 [Butyrivibrio proteoclasticus]